MTRLLALITVVASLTACSSGGRTTSSPSPSGGNAWVAGHLPDGFVIVSANERGAVRTVGYAPAPQQDPQIFIAASPPAAAQPTAAKGSRSVGVRGHDATLVTLTDEGQDYGFAVAWDERSNLRLVVEGSNGPSQQDTIAVAEGVRAISDAEWQRLLVELSPDTRVGRVDRTATSVEVLHGMVGAHEFLLTALVPGAFPLGPDDRRLDCFRLSYGSESTKNECPGHPIWARVNGQPFVFGDVDADIKRLRISGAEGTAFEPFIVETTAAPTGPPTRFYVAALPEGACAVSVDDPAGEGGPGVTGPLQDSPADYARCTGATPGQPPAPPTTAH